MNIIVRRGNQDYGPYPAADALRHLEQGLLLPHDLARDADNAAGVLLPLDKLLKQSGLSLPSLGEGGAFGRVVQDIKALNVRLLFPWQEIKSFEWFGDRKLLYLAGVGLSPMFALALAPGSWAGYWLIALYFSGLWSLFFYYLFRTAQIENRLCVACFFFTGLIAITVLMVVQMIPPWSVLYAMAKSANVVSRFVGMFLGVGINEELCKAAILFWLVKRPGKLLIPQSVVFYGMISGLGFGIYEGVAYQQTVNRAQGVDAAYFLNVARLTSLPFLHAIWTGIAGYFISFSALYPRRKYGLWVLAIAIPAILHAIYNTLGWSLPGLVSAMLGVVVLMTYLSNCARMQQELLRT